MERADRRPRTVPAGRRPCADGGETIGGVLLAAGRGTRFEGGYKLLATVEGEPIVRHAAETLCAASLADVVVVVGHRASAIEDALSGLDVAVRYNDDYRAGQSTSVRTGVEFARDRGWDGAVFALGDMPFVDPATVNRLLAAYRDGDGTALAPTYENQRGNPVVFDESKFGALATVTGDRGGRAILEAEGTVVPVDDPGVSVDIDRRSDLDRAADEG